MSKINNGLIISSVINNKARIYFAIKLIVAGLLIYYIISYVELKNILSTFLEANYFLLAACLALLVPNILLQYWKWKLTCDKILGNISRRKILMSLFYGFPAAVFTPGRAGEYFGRGLAFKDKNLSEIIIATAVDKFFTIIVTFVTGSISMIFFIDRYFETAVYAPLPLTISFFLFIVLGLAYLFSDKERFFNSASYVLRYKWLIKIREKLSILKSLDRKYAYKMIFVSFLFFMCYILQFTILLMAFSNQENFISYFWTALVIMFAKSILAPISLSEIGVREGAAIYFLTQMGESSSVALNSSLSLFAINIILPSLIGLILLFVRTDD